MIWIYRSPKTPRNVLTERREINYRGDSKRETNSTKYFVFIVVYEQLGTQRSIAHENAASRDVGGSQTQIDPRGQAHVKRIILKKQTRQETGDYIAFPHAHIYTPRVRVTVYQGSQLETRTDKSFQKEAESNQNPPSQTSHETR